MPPLIDPLLLAVFKTAWALREHDQTCREVTCLIRDGCEVRAALFDAHDEAVEAASAFADYESEESAVVV